MASIELDELLALLLGREPEQRAGLRELLRARGLVELSRSLPSELEREHGLRPAEALRLVAAFDLGRRVSGAPPPSRSPLRAPERVFRLLEPELRGLSRETFHVLLLDGKHALLRRELVSVGTLTSSLVHPREVLRPAVREAAAAVICAHNHPSGDPEPSPEDLAVTRRLILAGKTLGIPLLDHVVIGTGRFVSLRDRMSF
jgi:DNA repair protein RadC